MDALIVPSKLTIAVDSPQRRSSMDACSSYFRPYQGIFMLCVFESLSWQHVNKLPFPYTVCVIFHEKTKYIAPTIIFELRQPLPTTTFELLLLQIEVSSRCSCGGIS